MAIKFKDLKGKASSGGLPRMKLVPGINRFRIVSNVVPMYKYWMTTNDEMTVPMENLSFDRDSESFDSKEKNYVQEYFPEMKSSWAYAAFVIDRTDNALKILDLKKKLLGDVINAAKEIGDPSDIEEGWDIICDRIKTGPQTFNVEYKLEHFKLKPKPLSDKDRETIKDMPDIEEYLKRPTPEEQKDFIENRILVGEEETPDDVKEEFSDDIPFDATG